MRSDPRTGLWAVPAPRPCRWHPRGFSQKTEPRKPDPRPWTLHGGDCATPAPPPRPRKALESGRPQPGAVGPRPPGDPADPWPALAGSELPSSQASVQWGAGRTAQIVPRPHDAVTEGQEADRLAEQTLPRPRHTAWPSHSPDRYAKRFCSWSWMSAARSGLMSWCMIDPRSGRGPGVSGLEGRQGCGVLGPQVPLPGRAPCSSSAPWSAPVPLCRAAE